MMAPETGLHSRVCIIGAGPSGITAAKHCLQVGLHNIVVYDKNDQVGGNWVYSETPGHSSVYETAHIISSKRMSQYHDYPMPADYPDYPSHQLLRDYFQSYARDFNVLPLIQFNTTVAKAEPLPDQRWQITLEDGSVEIFDHLIVANGHHWDPRWPEYPGEFSGTLMHSHDYRSNLPFRDQRVLVVGGGNSACDIVVDVCRYARFAAISWRRGYYIVPKIIFGQPPDVVNARFAWLPRRMRQWSMRLLWQLVVGGNERYGLQKPDHQILESHPIANSELLYKLRHGDVHPRVDIARFDGQTVHFTDGRAEDYDTVIFATGYRISFPFFDRALIDFSEGEVPLYLRVFHADHPSLYFVGLVQPQGCIWPLADTQAQIVANRIAGTYQPPADMRERIAAEMEQIRRDYVHAARHSVEVEYHSYQQRLFREVPQNAPPWGQRVPEGVK